MKYNVKACVSDYGVYNTEGQLINVCNCKRNADLIAAILEKDSNATDFSNDDGCIFDAEDFAKVAGQYSIRTVYTVDEVRTTMGQLSRAIVPGMIVRHFKGNLYEVKGIVKHTETGEEMVEYQALYYPNDRVIRHQSLYLGQMVRQTFVRPLSMFLEEVDRKKYPYAGQTYRLEVVAFRDVTK